MVIPCSVLSFRRAVVAFFPRCIHFVGTLWNILPEPNRTAVSAWPASDVVTGIARSGFTLPGIFVLLPINLVVGRSEPYIAIVHDIGRLRRQNLVAHGHLSRERDCQAKATDKNEEGSGSCTCITRKSICALRMLNHEKSGKYVFITILTLFNRFSNIEKSPWRRALRYL